MYSVEEFLERADQASDVDDDLERVVENEDDNDPREDEAEEATEKQDEESSAKKVVKKVRKPSNRPKLDVERLKGPRGLASMEKLFSKIEFKGNGHEHEDLEAVMRTLHYWCHRLFPKYSFDDCLEHLERIGSKKPLITLKKKILYDLYEEDKPVVNDEDDINPDTQEQINEFDLLLQQEPISSLSQRPLTPERIELTEEQKEMIERNRLLAAERRKARLAALQQKQAQNENAISSSSELTEEQKEIIERNRQLALERRRAKNNTSITSSMVPSSQELNSTVNTVTSSQKSNQSVNFNELVDSFFPTSTEENTQKPDEDGVDINDLIEEINPSSEENSTEENQVVKSVETNKEIESNMQNNEDHVDIDDLLDITNTTVTEPSNTELNQQNEAATSTTKIDVIQGKKNIVENDKLDNSNLENSYDINSTKEDTVANLLEMEQTE